MFPFDEIASQSTDRFDLWRRVIDAAEVRAMTEVGVWRGDFAESILRSSSRVEKYYMIDPWATLPDWNKPYNVDAKQFDDIYTEAMNKTAFAADRVIVLRGRTKEVIDQIPDASLDFAYVDGDHTLRGITIDLIKLLPKIRPGGLLTGDDFANTPWQHDARFEPSLVCPLSVYFAEAMDLPIVALPHQQFAMKNDPNAGFSFVDLTNEYSDLSLNRQPPQRGAKAVKQKVKSLLRFVGARG